MLKTQTHLPETEDEAVFTPPTTSKVNTFMAKVFLLLSVGIIISAAFSYAFGTQSTLTALLYVTEDGVRSMSMLGWVVLLSPLLIVFLMSSSWSTSKLLVCYITLCVLMGMSLSVVFLTYTTTSIVSVFLTSAGMFLLSSLYGFVTKRDLSNMGTMLTMALMGFLIALVVNAFMQNTFVDFLLSCAGVVLFTVITAYDIQKIKGRALRENYTRSIILGALDLYLNLVNIFLNLLSIMGDRK
jgi:uncharacterized protein